MVLDFMEVRLDMCPRVPELLLEVKVYKRL
jgi:hypothetical protein